MRLLRPSCAIRPGMYIDRNTQSRLFLLQQVTYSEQCLRLALLSDSFREFPQSFPANVEIEPQLGYSWFKVTIHEAFLHVIRP
jgi:hypothetical protein